MMMGELTGEYGNRIFKSGVTYGTYFNKKMIMFTDEAGKNHEVCYGIVGG